MNPQTDRQPMISVVVCTFKRPVFLKRCLESLLSNTYDFYEIIVVSQGKDQTPDSILQEHFRKNPKIRSVRSEAVGLSPARNTGWNHARGDVVAFIDDDAVASREWIEGYAEIFHRGKPLPAMVGGKIEPLWENQRPRWYPTEREFLLGIYNIGNEIRPFPETDLPVGANFAILRSAVEGVGGFDERLGFNTRRKHSMIAGEDSLVALRLKEAGYPIYYQPKAKVYHHISAKKLTKTYFLKRHFWEGVTHVTIEQYRGLTTMKRLRGHLLWNMKKALAAAAKLPGACLCRAPLTSPQVMLACSEIACSLGVCTKSLELLVRNLSSKKT